MAKDMNQTPGFHTRREILQQGEMWLQTWKSVAAEAGAFRKFLSDRGLDKNSDILFCGAGSSEFAAQTVADIFCAAGYTRVRSVPTTDIVTDPSYYVHPEDTVLAFTFARSGNSPESAGAYEMLNRYCRKVYHVIVTCNKNGDMLRDASPERDFKCILPDPTNDVSLVMTSSFSSMCMAAVLLSEPEAVDGKRALVEEAGRYAAAILDPAVQEKMKEIASRKISRVVVLGGGPLKGIARECHLKMQEMTNGEIIAKYDTFLGLRHGPKAVIDEGTMVVYLLSDEAFSRRYELDLMRQVALEHNPVAQIALSKAPIDEEGLKLDLQINAPEISSFAENPLTFIVPVLIGQTMGYHLSVARGYNPDSPSRNGVISRVVKGVRIYEPEIAHAGGRAYVRPAGGVFPEDPVRQD